MTNLLNSLIEKIADVLKAMLNILPDSPFVHVQDYLVENKYLAWINYFFPVQELCTFMCYYVVAVLAYYTVRVVLRWIKLASN